MAETDVLPIDPDYPVQRSRLEGRAFFQAESGERIVRAVAPYASVFDLDFGERTYAEWLTLRNFLLAHHSDYFTFLDKSDSNRDYTVLHDGWSTDSEIRNESVNVKVRLVEQPGKPLRNYPATPLLTLPVAQFVTVAGVGRVATYPGYGYKITGSGISEVVLDGVSKGTTLEKYTEPLLLHTLLVKPASATLTTVQFVH